MIPKHCQTVRPEAPRAVHLRKEGATIGRKPVNMHPATVVVRPCRSSVTRQRRKLKKQAALVAKGIMTVEQVNQSYQSWRGSMKRLSAHEAVKRMDALYKELFG